MDAHDLAQLLKQTREKADDEHASMACSGAKAVYALLLSGRRSDSTSPLWRFRLLCFGMYPPGPFAALQGCPCYVCLMAAWLWPISTDVLVGAACFLIICRIYRTRAVQQVARAKSIRYVTGQDDIRSL